MPSLASHKTEGEALLAVANLKKRKKPLIAKHAKVSQRSRRKIETDRIEGLFESAVVSLDQFSKGAFL